MKSTSPTVQRLSLRSTLNLVFATTFATGFSGLVYEVTWQRYLGNLLGSEAKSSAMVLAVFLGGLALGYRAFGAWSQGESPKKLLGLCGVAELGIGAWAVFFPSLYEMIWNRIGVLDPLTSYSIFAELALAIALIGLPSFFMGCTLPLLTQGIAGEISAASKVHSKIYAINTLGAFFGCLVGGFFFLPRLGLPLTDVTMAGVNILAGAILIFLSNQFSNQKSVPLLTPKKIVQTPQVYGRIAVACLAGFVGISLQTILMRVSGIALGSSQFTFTITVALYILMLALGAARLSSTQTRISLKLLVLNQLQIIFGLILFYLLVPELPYWFMLLRATFSTSDIAFYLFYIHAFLLLGVFLFVPLMAMGRTLPLLFGTFNLDVAQSGNEVGRLYFWNSIGCVLGAGLGGYLLLNFFNLDAILKLCICVSGLALALLFLIQNVSKKNQLTALFCVLGVTLFGVFVPRWNSDFVGMGLFRSHQNHESLDEGHASVLQKAYPRSHVSFRRDDPNTSVSILQSDLPSFGGIPYRKSVLVNGKSDGTTDSIDVITTRLLAHIPMFLNQGATGKTAIVGFGTGITPGTLSLYENVNHIDCIEISSAVQEFSSEFSFINHHITKNQKFQWRNADAYRFLASQSTPYDLIISEPSNPWVGGVERLYSKEFYELATHSLGQRGIFAQWFHSYSISNSTLKMVLKTYASVFPHVRVFSSMMATDLILVGSMQPITTIGEANFNQRLASNERVKKDLAELKVFFPEDLLSLEIPIGPEMFADAAVHTLDFPKLSFAAGRDFFSNRAADLTDISKSVGLMGLYRQKSLLAQWLQKERPRDNFRIRQMAENHCEVKGRTLPADWVAKMPNCRGLILSLVFQDLVDVGSSMDHGLLDQLKDLAGLKSVLQPNKISAADSVSKAKTAILLFDQYQSVYFPLLPDRLIAQTKSCADSQELPAQQCQTQLVDVLVRQGFSHEAEKQLKAISSRPHSIPENVVAQFKEKILFAKQAESEAMAISQR